MVGQRIRNRYPCTVSLMIGLGVAILVGSAAHAQAPVPYPRIETGEHTAVIRRLAVDRPEDSRRVPELTKPAGYLQTPMRSARGQNFPIVRRPGNP